MGSSTLGNFLWVFRTVPVYSFSHYNRLQDIQGQCSGHLDDARVFVIFISLTRCKHTKNKHIHVNCICRLLYFRSSSADMKGLDPLESALLRKLQGFLMFVRNCLWWNCEYLRENVNSSCCFMSSLFHYLFLLFNFAEKPCDIQHGFFE